MLSVDTSTRPAEQRHYPSPKSWGDTQSLLQGVHKIIHKYMDNLRVITNMSGLRPLSWLCSVVAEEAAEHCTAVSKQPRMAEAAWPGPEAGLRPSLTSGLVYTDE